MQSALSDHEGLDFGNNINDLFLGVRERDGRVVVNTYLKQQVDEECLLGLLVSFTYQGQEVTFEVCELQRGIPMRLVLEPVNGLDTVREFLRNVVSVCLVPAVTFMENGEAFVIQNSRYNPNSLN